ncbi:hypothetical protein Ciccas_003692 [Cichlidogyrus casuarinus]|uniref:Dynein light chain n=1 Tax=Cichlidogyrus casuarinus TaxID=1844966 RepID=A0ABD2QDP5_9PLAT
MSNRDVDMPDDVEVILQDMPVELRRKVVDFVRQPLTEQAKVTSGDLKLEQIARNLKQYLQEIDSPMWHVVIVIGQFASFFGYIPGNMFHFKFNRFIVLVWKTPAN